MTMRIGPKGLDTIKSFEGFVPYVYDDLVASRAGVYPEWTPGKAIHGTLTIGYGHTDDAKYRLGFPLANVPDGFRLTKEMALHVLDVDLDDCEATVNRRIKVPLTQGQFDALVSFVFNVGEGGAEQIIARVNRLDYDGAYEALGRYIYSKGKALLGLMRRRGAEQALWAEKAYHLPAEPVDHPAVVDAEPAPTRPPAPPQAPSPRPADLPPKVATTPEAAAGGGIFAAIGLILGQTPVWVKVGCGVVIIALAGFIVFSIAKRKP